MTLSFLIALKRLLVEPFSTCQHRELWFNLIVSQRTSARKKIPVE
jgi:hypothetical protein